MEEMRDKLTVLLRELPKLIAERERSKDNLKALEDADRNLWSNINKARMILRAFQRELVDGFLHHGTILALVKDNKTQQVAYLHREIGQFQGLLQSIDPDLRQLLRQLRRQANNQNYQQYEQTISSSLQHISKVYNDRYRNDLNNLISREAPTLQQIVGVQSDENQFFVLCKIYAGINAYLVALHATSRKPRGEFDESVVASRPSSEYWKDNSTFSGRIELMYGNSLPQVSGKILDVGCSEGDTTIEIANHYPQCKVIGIDIYADVIEKAKKKIRGVKNLKVQTGDGYNPPFPRESFDLVFCNNNISIMVDEKNGRELVAPVAKLVRNGGYLAMASTTRVEMDGSTKTVTDHIILQRQDNHSIVFHQTRNNVGLMQKLELVRRFAFEAWNTSTDELYTGIFVDFYDNYIPEQDYSRRATQAIDILRSYNPSGRTLLELACGTGRYTRYLVREGFTVTATDISADEIERAQQKGIAAKFSVMDMSALHANEEYDAIVCFYESFRYLQDYKTCEETLRRIFAALRHNGIFLVDFSYFPAGEVRLPPHPVDIGNGLIITQQTSLQTKGDYDTRTDSMSYSLNGKDITNTKIIWHGKEILLKPTIERGSLLRISEEKMRTMLEIAGFSILEIRRGFAGGNESMLFVTQKT